MMSRPCFHGLLCALALAASLAFAYPARVIAADEIDPLHLSFHRQAVRRFIFSQEIPFGRFVPGETVTFEGMHPVSPTPGFPPCVYRTTGNLLEVTGKGESVADSSFYVSGINPFATYRLDVRSLSPGAEAAIEFATMDRSTRVQVVAAPAPSAFLTLRLAESGKIVREIPFSTGDAPETPYRLCVELSGVSVAAFVIKDGQTRFLGRLQPKEAFGETIDFRSRSVMAATSFNVATRIPPNGKIVLGEAAGALGSGMGQADIRQVTHADGAPFIEDNRFWFTFSNRGIGLGDSCQGVMSIDPSVFDPRFEGVVVFDRGDGLLRNDYASHLFYDDENKEWRAVTCCFSASPQGRGGASGLALARSPHDPRRGFSVMSETLLTKEQLPLGHEDPCILHDPETGKWRLLTSCFEKQGLRAELFESDRWDGTYTKIAGPVDYDSTGTLIQKIGSRRYVLSGSGKGPSGKGAIIAYSYPDLHCLGEIAFDLPVTRTGGRIWPGIFPLPPGYPARFMSLTMDRANFPGVTGGNWSYGALYLYWADTPDLNAPYEFAPVREVK